MCPAPAPLAVEWGTGRDSTSGVNGVDLNPKVRDATGAPLINPPDVSARTMRPDPHSNATKPVGDSDRDSRVRRKPTQLGCAAASTLVRISVGATGSNVNDQWLEDQITVISTNVLMNGQESGMAGEGSGSVGRITALVLKNNRQLRDHILLCTCSGVVNLTMLRTMRKLAEEALAMAEICDSQHAVADHFRKAISYGPNTVEHLANVGLHVVPAPVPGNVIPFRGRATIDTEIA